MQPGSRLVSLTVVADSFHAKVLVARLSSEGISCRLLGENEGPYPLRSEISVLVPEDDLAVAREILLADAVDAAFSDPVARPRRPTRWRRLKPPGAR